MTVSDTTRKIRADGDGAITAFTFTFKVFSETELEVYTVNKTTGVATLKTLTTDYTVVVNTLTEGGTVTYVTTVPASGEECFIRRVLARTQTTNIPNVGSVREAQLETPMDRAVMLIQEQDEEITRAVKFGDTSAFSGVTMTDPTTDKFLSYDGTNFVWVTPTNVTYAGTISYGTDAARITAAAAATVGDRWVTTDTAPFPIEYFCLVAAAWTAMGANAAKLLGRSTAANLPLVWAPTITSLGNTSTSLATNTALGNQFKATCNDDFTLANPTGGTDGQLVIWKFTQDSTGSRLITLGSKFRVGTNIGTPVLSTAASAIDYLGARYDSSEDKWDVLAFETTLA